MNFSFFSRTLLILVTAVGLQLQAAEPPHIVIMIGEDEYQTWETLPEFAVKELKAVPYRVTIIHADAADKNQFPGFVEAMHDADLLFISVRRRTPSVEVIDAVRAHLAAGKPLVGIRTASHCFALRPKDPKPKQGLGHWQEFDPQVLGGNYTGHYGKDPATITRVPGSESHPILRDVAVDGLIGHGGLYKNTPLQAGTTPLLMGTLAGQATEPVAWTHLYGEKKSRVFYTSMGHWDDFKLPAFRRFLLNGIAWALEK
ncbi:ThuA domain-containing protein [Prosthecobacter sp.]|uniref:ThuA domain-containing protein n=1 Tax=Prosthecobacter sp. TaxID=1965333 RepID=UPI001DFC6353|nr:ThuA domain-containing protein [Prosthecobacter sp.]MCB1275705.1 ThuA domain-containing protein [Prosthecobacter sp.]